MVDSNRITTKKEAYSYLIHSKTSQRFKDRIKKEIDNSNDYETIIKKVKDEEKLLELISIVNKADILFSFKREIINQLRKGEVTNEISLINKIDYYKIKELDMIKKEEEKEKERKEQIKQRELQKQKDDLIYKTKHSPLHSFSKNKLITEIKNNEINDLKQLSSKICSENKKIDLYRHVDDLELSKNGKYIDCPIKNQLKQEIFDGKLLSKLEINEHTLISKKLAKREAEKERERNLFEKRHEEYMEKVRNGEIKSEERIWISIEVIAENYCNSNNFETWEYEDGMIRFHRYKVNRHCLRDNYLSEDELRHWGYKSKLNYSLTPEQSTIIISKILSKKNYDS